MAVLETIVGRASERNRILHSIDSRENSIVVLHGPPLIGKSVLLKSLVQDWLPHVGHRAVYLDLAGYQSPSISEILDLLASAAVSKLQLAAVEHGDVAVRGAAQGYWDQICGSLTDNEKLVLVLDSFEQLYTIIDETSRNVSSFKNGFDADHSSRILNSPDSIDSLQENLAHLLQHKQIRLILGTNQYSPSSFGRLFPDQNSHIRAIRLDLLSHEDTNKLIEADGLADLISWSNNRAKARIWELTNGHPYLTKSLCDAVSDAIYQDIGDIREPVQVTVKMVDDAIPNTVERVYDNIEALWDSLSPDEQLVLSIIARLNPKVATGETIKSILKDFELSRLVLHESVGSLSARRGLTDLDVGGALFSLQQKRLIQSIHNVYRMRIALIHLWILENQPISESEERFIQNAYEAGSLSNIKKRPLHTAVIQTSSTQRMRKSLLAGLGIVAIAIVGYITWLQPGLPQDSWSLFAGVLSWNIQSDLNPNRPQESTETRAEQTDSTASSSTGVQPLENEDTIPEPDAVAQVARSELSTGTQDGETGTQVDSKNLQVFEPVFETTTESPIWSAAISDDETKFVAGLQSGQIIVWEIDSNYQINADTTYLEGHTKAVRALAFDPTDPAILASGSADNSIQIWNTQLAESVRILEDHTDEVLAIAYHPMGNLLASASADGSVKLWDPQSATLIGTLVEGNGWVLSVAFSSDGSKLATAGVDQTVQIWNVANSDLLFVLEAHGDWVSSMDFTQSDHQLATASYDKSILIWELTERRPQPLQSSEPASQLAIINSIDFHPSGRFLMSGRMDGRVVVWDLQTSHEDIVVTAHTEAVRSVKFSTLGNLAITSGLDSILRLWKVTAL